MPTIAGLGIVRLNQRFQLSPGNRCIHNIQKLFPRTLPRILFKADWLAKVIWRIAFSYLIQLYTNCIWSENLSRGSLTAMLVLSAIITKDLDASYE
jgi:hypothetical protein